MAYINIPSEEQLPGIRGLMAFSPETAKPLNALAEILLRDTNNSSLKASENNSNLCFLS
jgi:hypothetical protein